MVDRLVELEPLRLLTMMRMPPTRSTADGPMSMGRTGSSCMSRPSRSVITSPVTSTGDVGIRASERRRADTVTPREALDAAALRPGSGGPAERRGERIDVEHDPRGSARPDRAHAVQRKQRLRQAMAGDRYEPPQPPLRPGLRLVGDRQRRQRTSDLSLVRGRAPKRDAYELVAAEARPSSGPARRRQRLAPPRCAQWNSLARHLELPQRRRAVHDVTDVFAQRRQDVGASQRDRAPQRERVSKHELPRGVRGSVHRRPA